VAALSRRNVVFLAGRRPSRYLMTAVNSRCWDLAREEFLRLQAALLADLAEGAIEPDQVQAWRPRRAA
jgi:hypothetical protein